MRAEIITIGDEILIGQIVDTNSSYIAQQLNAIGIEVHRMLSIEDSRAAILEALAFAKASPQDRTADREGSPPREAQSGRAKIDLIILTGGLGPTKDDLTKHTFCEFFEDELVLDQEVLDHVEHLFKKYVKSPILEANRSQAMVPSKATILKNRFGTAPGMWMEHEGTVYIAMPGVPYEMKSLMEQEVLPRLQKHFERPYILHRTVLTYGQGESAIAERIAAWEDQLPSAVKLAYLPSLGRVRLRLSTKGNDKAELEQRLEHQLERLEAIIGDIIVGYEEQDSLEEQIGKLLVDRKATLATAESCTGGKIAQQITEHSGASAFFRGSVVAYATAIKSELLGVATAMIEEQGVVSEAVAKAMAEGAQRSLKSDYAIATTGVAGPNKGDDDTEVGVVYIGIATPHAVYAQRFEMGNHRERIIGKTVNKALEMLRKEILKN
ncbi:CinA family nicotinamide mononucleotide deamidase-related protein [Croceiramulus getboli]|nr:CinA family nicotinamide mononucleotide deamidase-related protein [Flavobacteriaceae bacterium YJPT1-3]